MACEPWGRLRRPGGALECSADIRRPWEKAVPSHTRPKSTDTDGQPGGGRPLRLLVVDNDPRVGGQVSGCLGGTPLKLVQVRTMSEAFKLLNKQTVDLVMIDADLPDGSGLALAGRLHRGYAITHAIVMARQPSVEQTIEAMRVGAVDLIRKPIDPHELKKQFTEAVARLRADRRRRHRVRRLKQVCKKLSRDREEIAQQVDILCSDLVIAYQDLAQQVQLLSQTNEFTSLIRQELDLETLLRRTLEYLLQKAGPTNGAIFLPASTDPDEYTLGGYVNYECASESAEILLQHLADALAPRMAQHHWPVHITEDHALVQWLGDDCSYLEENHLLAFPCRHEDDMLAVVVLFRHHTQPFGHNLVQTCSSIAPMLAQSLAKVVSIHHRLVSDSDGDECSPQ